MKVLELKLLCKQYCSLLSFGAVLDSKETVKVVASTGGDDPYGGNMDERNNFSDL